MNHSSLVAVLLGVSLVFVGGMRVVVAAATAEGSDEVFAWVNGEAISQSSYETALRVAGRQRFYHGRAPEAELIEFRREVGERLVNERILLQEAKRIGIAPDPTWVESEFAKLDRRYSASPEWHQNADTLKSQIRAGLEERSLIEQIDNSLKQVPAPREDAVRAFYERNPDKFTSPEQIKVSSILLKVEPWQPGDVWEQTREQAESIRVGIAAGAPFERYSDRYPPLDRAQLGYLHRGMLGQSAQDAIDKLGTGEVSEVVTLLEGVGLFRLDERIPARLNPLERVRERATALLLREQSEKAYASRIEALRRSAKVIFTAPQMHDSAPVITVQADRPQREHAGGAR